LIRGPTVNQAIAFLLTTSSFQLFYGKAYSLFSVKSIFLLAITIFEIGSLVCALAPNSRGLIVGRAIAGLGGSGIFSGGLIIIAHSVPLRTRPIFLGAMAGMFGIASVCGPLLGGVFTDKLTWRWCFYINLPFGAVTVIAVAFFFKPPPARPTVATLSFIDKLKKMDWLGMVLFIPSIVSLLLALQWGGSTYPWNDVRIIVLFVLFGVLGIAFGLVEYLRKEDAIVPPRILVQRSVAAGAWYAFCNGAGFLVIVYYTPLWHQVIHNLSAVDSGLRLLPLMVGTVIAVMMSGALVTVTGYCMLSEVMLFSPSDTR
jgi:MFS family permease